MQRVSEMIPHCMICGEPGIIRAARGDVAFVACSSCDWRSAAYTITDPMAIDGLIVALPPEGFVP